MTNAEKWRQTIEVARAVVPNVRIIHKRESWLIQMLGKLVFWVDFMGSYSQGFGRTVYMPDTMDFDNPSKGQIRTLQHELTHVIDSCTFFGVLPPSLWWLGTFFFAITYLLLPPIPGFGRGMIEMRAYRRNVELRGIRDSDIVAFRSYEYLWMLPLSEKCLRKMLAKPSPYRDLMDSALGE